MVAVGGTPLGGNASRTRTAKKVIIEKARCERFAGDAEVVAIDVGRYAEGREHFQDGGGAVAFLAVKTVHSVKDGLPVAERCQHRADWEEVGGVGEVGFETFERCLAHADGFVELRNDGAGLHQNVGDGQVGLEAVGVQACDFGLAEDGAGYQEVRRSAPVALEGEVGGFVALSALDAEAHLGAAAPVLVFDHPFIALHFGLHFDPEFAEDVLGDEHVGDALRL